MELLIGQDSGGHEAVTASLEALRCTVTASIHSKPRQRASDVVTLYEHACAIETAFNQVLCYDFFFTVVALLIYIFIVLCAVRPLQRH